MENVHVFSIDFVLAKHFAVADNAKRFMLGDFFFNLWQIEVVIPHDGVVRTQHVCVIGIVCVRLASGRVVSGEVEEVKETMGVDYFRNIDVVKT